MRSIPDWLILDTWILLAGLAIIIAYRMLTGSINTKGLLKDKDGGTGFSPARLQLLISTVTFSCYYIAQVVRHADKGEFPPVPREMLMVLGGSHLFYLGTKSFKLALETLASTIRKNS